ncbi:MAG: hypothetical protein JNM85_08585 [Chthonomonas sp.]|nr:hypothetical protein [Chthonomonas sp.]
MKGITQHITILDHLLMGLAAGLAAYSSLASIGQDTFAMVFAIGSVLAALVGHALRTSLPLKFTTMTSGFLYALVAIAMVAFARPLNELLPPPGYPWQIIMAGIFTWTVMVCGIVAWRDSTLCFQAVPCIAIFGLVGAFDTFKLASLFFFIFLICTATLFFRSHARRMVIQAEEALEPSSSETLTSEDVVKHVMQSGAWRWMAGPEWAVISALVIIMMSALGAPAIRTTIEPITQALRVNVPNNLPRPASANVGNNTNDSYQVGRGPASFFNTPVGKVKVDHPRLLRSGTFDRFSGTGWSRLTSARGVRPFLGTGPSSRREAEPYDVDSIMPQGQAIDFSYKVLRGSASPLNLPGEPLTLSLERGKLRINPDGTVEVVELPVPTEYSATVRVFDGAVGDRSTTAPPLNNQSIFYDVTWVSPEVRSLALEITDGATADAEKAERIMQYIGDNCRYSLNAPAVPTGKNVVDHFLFDSKLGYCDLFASAFASLARAAGLPTRIATGLLMRDPQRDERGYYTVKDSDYHMWAEVYFEEIGWVAFDATAYAEDVTDQEEQQSRSDWSKIFQSALLIVAAVAGLGLVIRSLFDSFQPKGVRARASLVNKQYLLFQRRLEKSTGKPRRMGETMLEYLDRVGSNDPVSRETYLIFERLFFARAADSDEAAAREARSAVQRWQESRQK